ncbi:MAG: hypothetical protein MR943_08865 [Lachnobacterium sp.]|nr:hypothetical protein [Lachnobacterium sp.]
MQILAHNLAAQYTNRQLNITTNQKAKSSEKLSSGYRINRSADDAAGLSISEEMRRQIRGLNKGGTNIQEGISLCQIADGALGEVTSILQRMRQLSIQAYNGTNSKSDRACIQDEIDNCLDGINEIQERTKYNELYVLKNNGRTQDTKQVWVDQSYTVTIVNEPFPEVRPLPNWLQLNDGQDQTINHDYSSNFSQNPSTSGTMRADYMYKDDANKEHWIRVYFGAEDPDRKDGYEWIGKKIPELQTQDPDTYKRLMDNNADLKNYVDQHFSNGIYSGWTADASDNAACKVDFGNLVKYSPSVDDLYANMFNLLGTELGFPCGSCYINNAIRFSGGVDGYEVANYRDDIEHTYLSADELSLSDYKFSYKEFYIDKDGNLQEQNKEYKDGYFGAIKNLNTIQDPTKQQEEVKKLAVYDLLT